MSRDQSASEEIQKRALSAMLTDAFFTWPSAVTIGFAIITFGLQLKLFFWWQPWYWLIVGVVIELIYLVATLTDPAAAQQAVSRMLAEKYDPHDIRNISARQQLQKALEYKKNIDRFVAQKAGALREALSQTADEIGEWIAMIYRLAKKIDDFEANSLIERNRRSVPIELENLKRRLRVETDAKVKAELAESIATKEQLLSNLKEIESTMKSTEIKLDRTLDQLSTVYTQMQLINVKEIDSGRAKRLREDIHEEIASLSDLISAMDDVYASQEGYQAGTSAALGSLSEEGASDSSTSDDSAAQRASRSNRA